MNSKKGSSSAIHLEEALRSVKAPEFALMLKPVGSACNLGCRYCYYLDKAAGPLIGADILECAIRSYADACDAPQLQFIWHGGEPLLAGLDFFRKAVELERRYSGGRPVYNSLQTNGTLLSAEWARFFRENNFLVGLSLDGPRDLHEHYRSGKSGEQSFDRVMAGLSLLREHGVSFNTLTTVNRASEGRGAEVYAFLKDCGSRHMQFLPVVHPSAYAIPGYAYGRFMADVFDEWVRADVGQYYVQLFDAALAAWCGLPPGLCVLSRSCSGTAVVEHNGDVYLCDHCVSSASCLGNIMHTPLRELMSQESVQRFANEKWASLPVACRRCPWLPACNGGCPVDRENGTSALCEGYRHFFQHAAPALDKMHALLAAGRPPADIIYT